jgi:hypothetical protein
MKTIRKKTHKRKRENKKNAKTKNRRKRVNKKNAKTKILTGGSALNSKLNCSPKPKEEMNNFSCYTKKDLLKLRDLWNSKHADNKIHSEDPKEIHEKLSNYLSGVCKKESCWLKRKTDFGENVKTPDLEDSFAPLTPKKWHTNPNEWLSSSDIINVMKQYEDAYTCFEFLGPTPIDFDKKLNKKECVWDELCNFSIAEQLQKGKTKIGIIFNTDTHDKSGEHWVSMFINIKKKQIFFFDSTGDKPQQEITKLVEKITQQGLKMSPPIHFQYDSSEGIEHQKGETECGIYSLYFIVHLLEDKFTTEYLKTHLLKDEYMEQFRKIYFNDEL